MERAFEGYFSELAARGPTRRQDLTAIELDTLRYLSHGLTLPMIADVRGVSRETVKMQVATARAKLAAKNCTHAVAIALRLGILT